MLLTRYKLTVCRFHRNFSMLYGRHVLVVAKHRQGSDVIYPGWVSDKSKFMKLKPLAYVYCMYSKNVLHLEL